MLTLVMVAVLALPTFAIADDEISCLTLEIVHDGDQERIENVIVDEAVAGGEIRYALVGSFAWFQWGHAENPDSSADDIVSVEVDDDSIASVTACEDGSITIVTATLEPPPAVVASLPDPATDWCDRFEGLAMTYCALENPTISAIGLHLVE